MNVQTTLNQNIKSDKFTVLQVALKNSFDFSDSKIHPQAVENLKKYMARKNDKSK
jgi:hypothetical protein